MEMLAGVIRGNFGMRVKWQCWQGWRMEILAGVLSEV